MSRSSRIRTIRALIVPVSLTSSMILRSSWSVVRQRWAAAGPRAESASSTAALRTISMISASAASPDGSVDTYLAGAVLGAHPEQRDLDLICFAQPCTVKDAAKLSQNYPQGDRCVADANPNGFQPMRPSGEPGKLLHLTTSHSTSGPSGGDELPRSMRNNARKSAENIL